MTAPTPPIPPTPDPDQPAATSGCPHSSGETMTCRHCVDFLLDYIDGLLPADQRAAFDTHLNICPDCTTYLDNYRKAAALTAGLGREDRRAGDQVPAGLVEAILKARKQGR